jgi:hypothetical protein
MLFPGFLSAFASTDHRPEGSEVPCGDRIASRGRRGRGRGAEEEIHHPDHLPILIVQSEEPEDPSNLVNGNIPVVAVWTCG